MILCFLIKYLLLPSTRYINSSKQFFSNHLNQWCPKWEACQWWFRGRGILGTAWYSVLGGQLLRAFITHSPGFPTSSVSTTPMYSYTVYVRHIFINYLLQIHSPLSLLLQKAPVCSFLFFRYLHQRAASSWSNSVLMVTFLLQSTSLIMDSPWDGRKSLLDIF